ncbi:MAG TPA: hypothetical protein VEA61_07760 [Allosphingosinicella sp.]|nr:hypothetical protein [Allosphingosinicella sp.]
MSPDRADAMVWAMSALYERRAEPDPPAVTRRAERERGAAGLERSGPPPI